MKRNAASSDTKVSPFGLAFFFGLPHGWSLSGWPFFLVCRMAGPFGDRPFFWSFFFATSSPISGADRFHPPATSSPISGADRDQLRSGNLPDRRHGFHSKTNSPISGV
jgi:hypothetical protein